MNKLIPTGYIHRIARLQVRSYLRVRTRRVFCIAIEYEILKLDNATSNSRGQIDVHRQGV